VAQELAFLQAPPAGNRGAPIQLGGDNRIILCGGLPRFPPIMTAPMSDPTTEEYEISDEELMMRIQQGQEEALGMLYDRYSGVLKSLIMRVIHNDAESDDLLQEIFVELWNQSGTFSPKKGKPLGWIVTLTRRRAIDRLRKRQAYARVEEKFKERPEQQPEAWVQNTLEDDIELNDARRVLNKVLNELPDAQRQAIELAYFKGMSQREVAAHTGIPLGTIKTRLELGLKKISEALKGLKHELTDL